MCYNSGMTHIATTEDRERLNAFREKVELLDDLLILSPEAEELMDDITLDAEWIADRFLAVWALVEDSEFEQRHER